MFEAHAEGLERVICSMYKTKPVGCELSTLVNRDYIRQVHPWKWEERSWIVYSELL